MKKPFLNIIFLGILYFVIYSLCIVVHFTYYNMNIFLSFLLNVATLIILVYIIDKFVKKIDKDD